MLNLETLLMICQEQGVDMLFPDWDHLSYSRVLRNGGSFTITYNAFITIVAGRSIDYISNIKINGKSLTNSVVAGTVTFSFYVKEGDIIYNNSDVNISVSCCPLIEGNI